MAGSVIGGKRASECNKKKYGADFYARVGSLGGKKKGPKGFGSPKVGQDGLTGRERARIAGSIGGKVSKRGRAPYDPGKL